MIRGQDLDSAPFSYHFSLFLLVKLGIKIYNLDYNNRDYKKEGDGTCL